jgi:GMP synthase (glutamine-hydrolysing)
MPRILIFNGAPEASQKRIGALGGPSNDVLFTESVGRHAAPGKPIDFFTLNVADAERLPQGLSLGDFDGVVISGSPLNVYHDIPAVRGQIELAREVFEAGLPTFGSCWGLQLMTAALGGRVRLNPNGREVGVARNITLNEAGREHALFRGKGHAFDALCTHEDEVEVLPACGRVLASNAMSRVQAAEMTDGERCFWGVQYHPEHVLALTAAIMTARAERHVAEGLARSVDEVHQMAADLRALGADAGRTDIAWRYGIGREILDVDTRTAEFRNWLDVKVMPYAARRA